MATCDYGKHNTKDVAALSSQCYCFANEILSTCNVRHETGHEKPYAINLSVGVKTSFLIPF
jgi:hypothetical protein